MEKSNKLSKDSRFPKRIKYMYKKNNEKMIFDKSQNLMKLREIQAKKEEIQEKIAEINYRIKNSIETEEKKRKEEKEIFKLECLKKMNKKEEDLTETELAKIMHDFEIKKRIDEYEQIKYIEFENDYEGKDIRYTLEEIK